MTEQELATVPGQLEEIKVYLKPFDKRLQFLENGHREIKESQIIMLAALKKNTEVTEDIRDIVTAGRVGTKIIKWFGGMAAAIGATWAAWATIFGAKPPSH